ncbi:osteomodulin-like [Mytilus trossulus]|uniref:osteomodulin-like n=1 Tax=Mytilus trossulus TaxID=6551 RepID=UPI0030046244
MSKRKTIPNLPSNINFLNLKSNRIILLYNSNFNNLNDLLELDLSWNKLERMEFGSFTGLINLQKLILEHNNLSLQWKSFPHGIFAPLKSLTHLNAKYNDWDGFLACKNVVTKLTQLEIIEIDIDESPACPDIDYGFSKLTNLKSFVSGYCNFTLFGPITFENMKCLQFVDISRCSISVVLDDSFQGQKQLKHPKLKTIILSHNILSDISFDMSTLPTLEMLNLSHNNIQAFSEESMESIYSRGGQNILFLVFLEQIRPSELPLVMLELVQKQSYIEYPNDEQGNVVFWDKIKETLIT